MVGVGISVGLGVPVGAGASVGVGTSVGVGVPVGVGASVSVGTSVGVGASGGVGTSVGEEGSSLVAGSSLAEGSSLAMSTMSEGLGKGDEEIPLSGPQATRVIRVIQIANPRQIHFFNFVCIRRVLIYTLVIWRATNHERSNVLYP